MNFESNVQTITEQTQFYQSMAIILLAVSIALFISTIVIFIVFRIPHAFRVITGMGMNKEMSKAAAGDRKRQKATLNWNTSGTLNAKPDFATTILENQETVLLSNDDATTLLEDEMTTVLGSDETTVLGADETTVLGTEETTVLSDDNSFFELEDEIKITGSNKNI